MPEHKADVPTKRFVFWFGLTAVIFIVVSVLLINFGNTNAAECPARPELAAAIDQAATGELAALVGTAAGRSHKGLTFVNAEGKAGSLADFAGKAVLVNFWAAWCVPCREEMPALDALAARHNDVGFEVVPFNVDIGDAGLAKAKAFLADADWLNLPLYADPSYAAFEKIKTQGVTIGLPATVLLDAEGCEVAVLQGPAHWDSPDGDRVIAALKGLTAMGG